MFIYSENGPDAACLITQAAHQGMAWQLAEHWGNRRFARPMPRWEVLAAVLLHDSGWNDFDRVPGIDAAGRPLTFDRMPVPRHLEIWRESIVRAAAQNRYAGLLVAAHFAHLAETKLADAEARGESAAVDLIRQHIAWSEQRRLAWTRSLAGDPRFKAALDGEGRRANARILAGCDRISVYLCADLGSRFSVEVPRAGGGVEAVEFEAFERRRYKVRPWPFAGDRVRLHCEALDPGATAFADQDALHRAMESAPVRRLRFEVVRTSRAGG